MPTNLSARGGSSARGSDQGSRQGSARSNRPGPQGGAANSARRTRPLAAAGADVLMAKDKSEKSAEVIPLALTLPENVA